jgi:RND family efflux transporter MFP subunit
MSATLTLEGEMSDGQGSGRLRRALRRLATTAATLGVIGLAAGAGVLAYGTLSSRAAVSDAPSAAPALPVAPERIAMQPAYETERRFTGQFEAGQETPLAFEEGGTIAAIAVREGARVARGDLLARLDTRLLEAERARLVASRTALTYRAELARRTAARQAELRDRGFASDQRVDDTSLELSQIEARIREADAGIAALDIRVAKAELRAPYAGTVGARLMDLGAIAAPGAPVLTLLEGGEARFRVGVAPDLAAGLQVGAPAFVATAGGPLPARLAEVAPDLDPATRARTLFFAVDGAAPPSRATAELILTQRIAQAGAWLPLAALRQGPRGTWQIVTVVEGPDGPVAGVEAAEVIALDDGAGRGARAYVRGTFADGALYLPEGVHRVVAGEPVSLRDADPALVAEAR